MNDLPVRIDETIDVRTELRIDGRQAPVYTEAHAPQLEHEIDLVPLPPGEIGSMNSVRVRHHEIARLLALGLGRKKTAEMVGVVPQTITVLLGTPAFKNLLAYYISVRNSMLTDVGGALKASALSTLEILQRKVETEDVPFKQVVDYAMALADRAGYAPVQKSVTKNYNGYFSAEDLREIKEIGAKYEALPKDSPVGSAVPAAKLAPETDAKPQEAGGKDLREEGLKGAESVGGSSDSAPLAAVA